MSDTPTPEWCDKPLARSQIEHFRRHPQTSLVHITSSQFRYLCELALSAQAAESRAEAMQKDAERYRARREYQWCEYDDYCISVMPRDGSATRQGRDEFFRDYDGESDGFVEDYAAIDACVKEAQ